MSYGRQGENMLPVQKEARSKANPSRAEALQRFFKTGKGEYGEGDRFLGLTVPQVRKLARENPDLDTQQLSELLGSPWHEERLLALLILVRRYGKASSGMVKNQVFRFYLRNTRAINNWDLVDVTCRDIVGAHLHDKNRSILYRLARSRNLWERRIAVISTSYFINQSESADALAISEILLHDDHDLIHKAVGWMLREVGKRCSCAVLENFLDKHAAAMPRVMLRYSLEKMTAEKRAYYMSLGSRFRKSGKGI
jgi:3-methyladenine DNA glycosylase AlkD